MSSRAIPNKFLQTFLGFEKTKTKTHFFLIVLIHAAGWCLLFLLPVFLYPIRINDGHFIPRELIDKSVLVVLFYVNYYLLIPRFFEKKKYLTYSSLIVLAFIIYLAQLVTIRANYFQRSGGPFQFIQVRPSSIEKDSLMPRLFYSNVTVVSGEAGGLDSIRFVSSFDRPIPVNDSLARIIPPFRMREHGLFGIPKGVWLMTLNNAISSFALLLLMGG